MVKRFCVAVSLCLVLAVWMISGSVRMAWAQDSQESDQTEEVQNAGGEDIPDAGKFEYEDEGNAKGEELPAPMLDEEQGVTAPQTEAETVPAPLPDTGQKNTLEEYRPEPEFKSEPQNTQKASDEDELLPAVVEEEPLNEKDLGKLDEGKSSEKAGSASEQGGEESGNEEEGWTEESQEKGSEGLAEIENALEESKKIPTLLTNLDDCKKVAMANNPRIQVALKEFEYERLKVMQAERDFLPGVKGTYQKQNGISAQGSGGGSGQGFIGLQYQAEVNQKIFTGGKNFYTLKQNKTKLFVAKKKYEQARQEMIYNVEKAYYGLVKAQMVFEIQTELSKAAEAALSFSREAYRQGLNSYQEFLNVQSQTDQTYYQLLSAQQEIALNEMELRKACNVDAGMGIQINAVLTFTDFDFNYSLDECLGLGFKNRPDLAVNEFTTLADLYGIKIAMADTMPQIEFIGDVGKNGQSQENAALALSDEWDAKLQATWVLGANSSQYSFEKKKSVPTQFGQTDNVTDSQTHSASFALFDKIENLANVAKSKVDRANSKADLIELRGNVMKDVVENYFNYQKAMTQVTAALSKIKFREKDLEINRAKQMMDEIPLSQVLTSELQLGEERANYVQALADYYTAISGLFKAMGLSK